MNMESFRTEIEDPIVQKEIVDLERKLLYSKKARLMISQSARARTAPRRRSNDSIKLPFGKVTSEQLERITKVSDEYSTGRLYHHTPGYPNPLCKFR
jgi:sulfite reductase (ferredoxin)